ncbi:MAG: recombinase family protein [Clostridia bacterium]|nr:recombinase family protein [Clostridia bacterium]
MAKKKQTGTTAQAGTVCVVYARYSSHAQNDASIEQQVAECREYAAAHDLKISKIYADRAISGRSDRRPEFQKMLRAAERREFEIVLAYKSNRISRNMLHALSYEDKLAKYDINVIYCKEEFGNNAAGRFALRTMMNVNQFYSENMAEDIVRGLMDNASQCRVNGALPLGYKRGEDGKYAIDEETAPIVQEIFRRIADGELKAHIADDLNARQIKTSKGGAWNKGSFHSMLQNERYIGVYIYGDVRIPGGIPPIIDEELFEMAKEREETLKTVIKSRRRRDDMDYLLTGKLFCGYCLDPMVGTSGTSKTGTMYYYYRCKNNAEKHTCRKKPVRKDAIEKLVVSALKACVTKPENVEWMTDLVMKYRNKIIAESDLGYLEEKLHEIKTSTKNLMKAIEAGIITETTKARLQELEAEQKEVLSNILIEKRSIPDVDRDHVHFYFDSFKNGDVNDKKYQKMIIRHFLRAVYLYDDHIKITFSYDDNDTGLEIPIEVDDASDNDEVTSVLIGSPVDHQTVQIRNIQVFRVCFLIRILYVLLKHIFIRTPAFLPWNSRCSYIFERKWE